ncbi:MAG: penicillin-binding protein 1C [Microscillaceae bacterium]|jgi:penicillin-binding protein 1C|nr:penicillin-binding protein 1C [Microscillaceae bacterium]
MNKLPLPKFAGFTRLSQKLTQGFTLFFKNITRLKAWQNLGRKITQRRNLPYTLGALLLPFAFFLLLDWIFPIRPRFDYSPVVLAQDSTVLHTYLTKDQKWRLKTELSEIIPELRQTLIYKEDKYFYYHPGFNPIAIGRAFLRNLLYFKKTSGASTITMQVARLLEPKRRTYANKFWEIWRALQLEWHYSKDEILQIYINHLPYGSNIEGIKSASLFYFNRMPQQLSLAQIVTLTIIPNRPTSLVMGKNNHLIVEARNQWLKRLLKSQIFPPKNLQNALSEALQASRLPAPAYAPHFCHRLKKNFPHSTTLYTSLNWQKQEKVQQLTLNFIRRLEVFNIHNASVLVINNRTRQVEVYVGSADFKDKFNSGEVDGIQGIRSPGSTLKPMVYALGLDKGFITPKTILLDVPSSFSGFAPENFYKQFLGKVSVEQALVQSLNIPAVKTLEEIGVKSFINKLKQADFQQISRDEKKLGLSMVLGGCGVTLEEMVNLFAVFARQGYYQKAKLLPNEKNNAPVKLISPEAAYTITEILATAKRPDLPSAFENTYRIPKIAWKTGTSYGRRDAWSIGYNAHYTVGVWVGNFSGEGVNNLIGAEVATPLLFDVFNSIDYNPENDWFKVPKGLKVRWVCSESGLIPNEFCPNQVIDYYLPLASSTQKCQHLKEVIVSADEKTSFCLSCQPVQGWKKRFYPNLSAELLAYFEAKGLNTQRIPPHNSACTRVLETDAPVILSPTTDKEYIIDRQNPPEIQLACKVSNEVKTVYWYINHQFYQATAPTERVFFKPQLGLVHIACSDDKGRNAEVQIRVSYE